MSNWWPECVDRGADTVIQDSQTRALTGEYKELLVQALDGSTGDAATLRSRRTAAIQFAALATDVWKRKQGSAMKRSHAHNAQRLASAFSAVAAGGGGVALAAGLSGTAATVFAIIVVIVGLVGLAVAAIWPEAEYERNRAKARHYEALWRDIWAYATLTLPTASPGSIAGKYEQFSATNEAVGDA